MGVDSSFRYKNLKVQMSLGLVYNFPVRPESCNGPLKAPSPSVLNCDPDVTLTAPELIQISRAPNQDTFSLGDGF